MSKAFNPKLVMIGSGQIGGILGLISGLKKLSTNLVMLDVVDGLPQGKALDMAQAFACEGLSVSSIGCADISEKSSGLDGADVVLVTAGFPRKAGMTREDLLLKNAEVIGSVGKAIKARCPNAFVVCITNPLDVMVAKLQETSGLPHNKVVGMAGVLDTSRFRYFLAQELGVAVQDIQALVLGGHGDLMVPCLEYTSISGVPLKLFIQTGQITQEKVDAIVTRTREGGAEVVELLKTGSAFVAPALSALKMIQAYLRDEKRLLPCCAYVNGEYGLKMYGGVPVILGKNGVEKIVELPLEKGTKEAFHKSMEAVKSLYGELQAAEARTKK